MRSLLDLHDDVLYILGQEIEHLGDRRQTLFNAGSTCRKLREHFSPFLYRRITQEDTLDDCDAYDKALGRGNPHETTACAMSVQRLLHVLESSTIFPAHTREVNIMKHGTSFHETMRLVFALTQLQQLRKLRLALTDIPAEDVSGILYRCHFASVSTLCISPGLDDLSAVFPNVDILNLDFGRTTPQIRDWTRPVSYQHIRHLELGHMIMEIDGTVIDWEPSTLERMAGSMPFLEYLGSMKLDEGFDWDMKVPGLAHFRNLRDFSVCWIWDDMVRAVQLQDCEICLHMDGKDDAALCERHVPHVPQIMSYLGRCAFQACASLERVWIGRREHDGGMLVKHGYGMVACDRDEDGGIKSVRWCPEAKLASPFFPPISDQS